MKCQECQALLPTYADGETNAADTLRVEAHLRHCRKCQAVYARVSEEVELIRDGWMMEMLPDDFANEVMQQIQDEGIEVEKSDPVLKKGGGPAKRRGLLVSSVVAAAVLVMAIGTQVSPAFAAFLSSFFQTITGEAGLRQAAKQGFSTELNQAVSDNGITLRVKEVIADPTRIVLSYVLEDAQGRILPDQFFPAYGANNVYVVDANDKVIRRSPLFRRTDKYADLVFPLENPPEQVTVHLEIKGIGSKELHKTHLNMEIPVDLRKGIAATKKLKVEEQYTSPKGMTVKLGQITYAPSATALEVETEWTLEAREKIVRQVEELKAKGAREEVATRLLSSHHPEFTIRDKEGNILADSRQNSNYQFESGLIYTLPGSNEQQAGSNKMTYYFAPFEEPAEDVFFHLEDVFITERAAFSLVVPLHGEGLRGGEYEGNHYEVLDVREEKATDSAFSTYRITVDSIQKSIGNDPPEWLVTDKEGNVYKAEFDVEKTRSYSDQKGSHTVTTLIVKEVPKEAKEVTLSLVLVERQLPGGEWKIKLPDKNAHFLWQIRQ
ncbi:DUF4179 domain-containing protein [Brevibacillus borstelensis]|uniref:DUF4179 domain-containing protein n=2 Tax=Bacillati TaxID=1783272 RepID=UPI0030F8DC12